MLVEVTDGRRTTYRYRHKLSYFGLKPKGRKWTLTTSDNDIVDYINSFCHRKHLTVNIIENKYIRSSKYRSVYFHAYPSDTGVYRCVYCGKRMSKDKITVDHVIPIQKVQQSDFYKNLLVTCGIDSVNDPKNLAPACEKCNKKKAGSFSLKYYFLAKSGKQPHGIAFRRFIKFICVLCITFDVLWIIFLILMKIQRLS